ncbi:MAG: hypothetical protein U9O85_08810 [Euryarchaeota archaeon]|nr:hypothetical protein [Euryarchaeota archaeon]
MEEEKTLYKRLDEETIDKERLGRGLKRAGRVFKGLYRHGWRAGVISEIPRKVAELDKLLGIDVFPKMMRSYGLK